MLKNSVLYHLLFMVIKHLTHQLIDFERWDQIVSSSSNGLVYANSWFLNIVSPGWEALVTDDYEYIFPIPMKKKYNFPYIVQPIFTQQLGVFSNSSIDIQIVKKFIQKITLFSYEINLNECNFSNEFEHLPNYVLNLNAPYLTTYNAISKNTLRNIDKAQRYELKIEAIEPEHFINFYCSSHNQYQSNDFKTLTKLVYEGFRRDVFRSLAVRNNTGEIIAAVVYSVFKNRITFLIPVSTKEGKEKSSMFLIVNELIKLFAGKNFLLDFEGSKNEGVARFYKGFGALNKPYNKIKNMRPTFLVGRI